MKRASLIILLCTLAGLSVYRAATQSFTIDEAFSFLSFTRLPLRELATAPYDANNHVLFTLLSRASFLTFGNSELALRLPTVLAAFVFYGALYFLVFRVFGDSCMAPLAGAVVATQPLLQDHLAAARGYGLAIALWTAGLLALADARASVTVRRRRLVWAGMLFGAAIAANLMFLFPTLAVLAAYVWVSAEKRLDRAASIAIPAALVALALLAVPLSHMGDLPRFYFGSETLSIMLTSVINTSVSSDLGIPAEVEYSYQWWFLIAAMAVSFAGILVVKDRIGRLVCATTTGTFALTVAAHVFRSVPYPMSRTALPLLVLTLLSACVIGHFLFRGWLRSIPMAAVALLIAMQAAAIRTSWFAEWPFDADTRAIAKRIGAGDRTVCASWLQEPSLNYYLQGHIVKENFGDQCEFRVVLPDDPGSPEPAGQAIFHGQRSGATLYQVR